MNKLYYYIDQGLKGSLQTAKEYSIPLIACALAYPHYKVEFINLKQNFVNKLTSEISQKGFTSENCWMAGRIKYSLLLANETPVFYDTFLLSNTQNALQGVEFNKLDSMHAWAYGYFAIENKFYDAHKDKFIKMMSERCKNSGDKIWAGILFLNSASFNNDLNTYNDLKENFVKITEESGDVVEQIKQLPLEDYRGWALSSWILSEIKLDKKFQKSQEFGKGVQELQEICRSSQSVEDLGLIDAHVQHLKDNYSVSIKLDL